MNSSKIATGFKPWFQKSNNYIGITPTRTTLD
jgi:hypothetical protein